MVLSIRKAVVLSLLLVLAALAFSAGTASAQETGTLIVYTESRGGDASFSYTGSPSQLGNFQMATELGGGARVFNLTAGTYTIRQAALPVNWVLEEVFCDGTGAFTVNQSQAKATVTVTSFADVFYLRFTNYDNSVIPEYPSAPVFLVLLVVASLSALGLTWKHKKRAAPALAVMFSACILIASTGTAMASPDKYIQLGTRNADEQIQFGIASKDMVVQLGFGGNDLQYLEADEGDDWIIQNGGSGNDAMIGFSGSGNDHLLQDGGDGNDTIYGAGGDGNKTIIQRGGAGNDIMEAIGSPGSGLISINGNDGDDTLRCIGGSGLDSITIEGGLGNDNVTYAVTGGIDSVRVDGGPGSDYLTINKSGQQNFQGLDGSGAVMFLFGSDDSTIRVISVEHGKVVGDSSETLYQW